MNTLVHGIGIGNRVKWEGRVYEVIGKDYEYDDSHAKTYTFVLKDDTLRRTIIHLRFTESLDKIG